MTENMDPSRRTYLPEAPGRPCRPHTLDEPLPDLSAFLSPEELDQSVDLARKAIREDPTRSDGPHLPFPKVAAPSERLVPARPSPGIGPLREPSGNYGPETQSKKEFLNKAADFIEELSSLFKANSSRRIRPRACRSRRSQAKPSENDLEGQGGGRVDLRAELIAGGTAEELQPPQFLQKLRSREVPAGSPVRLDCVVTGRPAPEVRWFCEGSELENSPDVQVFSEGQHHWLVISEAFEEDTGRYCCLARNCCGSDSVSAEIFIEGASSSDSDQEAQNQSRLPSTTSSVTHTPQPTADPERPSQHTHTLTQAETHNHINIHSHSDTLTKTEPHTLTEREPHTHANIHAQLDAHTKAETHTLTEKEPHTHVNIPSQSETHTLTNAEPHIHPESKPHTHTQSEHTHTEGSLSEEEEEESAVSHPQTQNGGGVRRAMAPPVFTKALQDAAVLEKQLVVLECRVKGSPSPRVQWFRQDTPIQDSPDYRILQKKPRGASESEEICTLVIAEVFLEDSGRFRCTATNTHGSVSSEAELTVTGLSISSSISSVFRPPAFNHKPDSSVTQLHSSLMCLDPLSSSLRHHQPGSSGPERSASLLSLNPVSFRSSSFLTCPRLHTPPPAMSRKPRPPTSCLKGRAERLLGKHNSASRAGLRVTFRLPEEEDEEEEEDEDDEDDDEEKSSKEPPPVLAKPKLDLKQLEILHNQVLLEQLESSSPRRPDVPQPTSSSASPKASPPLPPQLLPEVTPACISPPFSTTALAPLNHHPVVPTVMPTISLPSTTTSAFSQRFMSPVNKPDHPQAPLSNHLQINISPAVPITSVLAISPVAVQNLPSTYAPAGQSSSLKLEKPHMSSALPISNTSSPSFVQPPCQPPPSGILSPTLPQSFSYTRPKEFLTAQCLSPIRSPSPTQSPVPMLHELAAMLFPPSTRDLTSPVSRLLSMPRSFHSRVVEMPSSPPAYVASPPPLPASRTSSVFSFRPQSPPQASSPTSSGSSPSPIQNPVAFLSSVLPSLPACPPTNAMGLPRRAPVGLHGLKKSAKGEKAVSEDDVRTSRETLLLDLQKKLHFAQQKTSSVSAAAGLNSPPAASFNYHEEYKVSSFEQRLMSEIEFRLERTPVEESDEEVQHDEIPTGRCIAPIFDRKLKHFRAVEGVPVTFTCKIIGIPIPKVYWFKDGKQILKKNVRYQKIREADGMCSLHIQAVTGDDDGNYTVMAANPQGRISCSGHLIVQTGPARRHPLVHAHRVRARVQEVEGDPALERFFRPQILQAPGDLLAHEGQLCRLDCKVSGLPQPEIMWLLNGKPVYPDESRRLLVRENGMHSLLMEPLTASDDGTYTCIASNKAGQSSFSLQLTVLEKQRKVAPQFVEKLQNTGVAEGAAARLDCRLLGTPPPVVYWKKDNESLLPSSGRVSMHQDSAQGYVCLLIHAAGKEDAGWYTVSAHNPAGVVSCTARLDIYAQWHQHVHPPMRKKTGSVRRDILLPNVSLPVCGSKSEEA